MLSGYSHEGTEEDSWQVGGFVLIGLLYCCFLSPLPRFYFPLGGEGLGGSTSLVRPFSVLSAHQWSRRVWGKKTGEEEGDVSRRKGCLCTFTAVRLVLPMFETEWRCKGKEGKTTKKQAGQTDTSSNSFSS